MSDPLPEPPSDAGLVARMAEGDLIALSALYQRHFRAMYALARTMLRNNEEAEDLTHDVFLEAWRRSADYSEERGSVRAWLFMRARSRALDRLKAAGRSLDALLEAAPRATPTSLVDRYRLRERLAKMPEPQRQVLILDILRGSAPSRSQSGWRFRPERSSPGRGLRSRRCDRSSGRRDDGLRIAAALRS